MRCSGGTVDFWLGVHHPGWLRESDVPMFVSRNRLCRYRTLPRARGPWALDSGGFTELSRHGRWTLSPAAYVAEARRYAEEVGLLAWAAPQDWMCEPSMLRATGLSVADHQERTTANLLELRALCPSGPFVPVLQGWTPADYLRHVEAYDRAGVDLMAEPLVGVGTVCRRQDTRDAEVILRSLAALGLRLHGFGVKLTGLARFSDVLISADSMAWSYTARRQGVRLPGCVHRTCANCRVWAEAWRQEVLAVALRPREHQIPLLA